MYTNYLLNDITCINNNYIFCEYWMYSVDFIDILYFYHRNVDLQYGNVRL